jgi:hypothetical protein
MRSIDPERVTDAQYEMIAQNRLQQNELIWQTPVLSLTGQAFLFAIAFGDGALIGKLIASALILATSFASLQLLAKHRALEVHLSKLLEDIEVAKGIPPIHRHPKVGTGFVRWSSYRVWYAVLAAFGVAAIAAALTALYSN